MSSSADALDATVLSNAFTSIIPVYATLRLCWAHEKRGSERKKPARRLKLRRVIRSNAEIIAEWSEPNHNWEDHLVVLDLLITNVARFDFESAHWSSSSTAPFHRTET
ncbi:MAG: hypothetical protein Udaeo2_11800 [Candidatus Udaeobacter sp.]|nr:MAG: hypothetical protein Udaeo2_11800 [Candidatus Udaeobacter sp.]